MTSLNKLLIYTSLTACSSHFYLMHFVLFIDGMIFFSVHCCKSFYMKNIQKGMLALLVASSITIYSCGPTDDKGGMDTENSKGEGAIDSSRLTNFDSTSAMQAGDSSQN